VFLPFKVSYWNTCDFFYRVVLKYIDQAAERLKDFPKDTDRELTVLGKILAKDPNPKTAMVMALDTIFAAIDTVSLVRRN
jgi:hypothetical protein